MKVLEIELTDRINNKLDVLTVKFDTDLIAYMFYPYSDALQFIGKEVEVDFRDDYYKGNIISVINTMTEYSRVYMLNKEKDYKLYSEVEDNHSNVVFADLEDGENVLDAVMFCVKQEASSSDKATWMSFTVRDKRKKLTTLRLFDYEAAKTNLTGKYVRCDITKSKYGLTTSFVRACESLTDSTPDLAIAEKFIKSYLVDYDDIREMLDKNNFYDWARVYVGTYLGDEMIKLSFELKLISTYKDMIGNLEFDALVLALVSSHLHVLEPNSPFSKSFVNMFLLSRTAAKDKKQALIVMDNNPDNNSLAAECELYKTTKELSESLLNVRSRL